MKSMLRSEELERKRLLAQEEAKRRIREKHREEARNRLLAAKALRQAQDPRRVEEEREGASVSSTESVAVLVVPVIRIPNG